MSELKEGGDSYSALNHNYRLPSISSSNTLDDSIHNINASLKCNGYKDILKAIENSNDNAAASANQLDNCISKLSDILMDVGGINSKDLRDYFSDAHRKQVNDTITEYYRLLSNTHVALKKSIRNTENKFERLVQLEEFLRNKFIEIQQKGRPSHERNIISEGEAQLIKGIKKALTDCSPNAVFQALKQEWSDVKSKLEDVLKIIRSYIDKAKTEKLGKYSRLKKIGLGFGGLATLAAFVGSLIILIPTIPFTLPVWVGFAAIGAGVLIASATVGIGYTSRKKAKKLESDLTKAQNAVKNMIQVSSKLSDTPGNAMFTMLEDLNEIEDLAEFDAAYTTNKSVIQVKNKLNDYIKKVCQYIHMYIYILIRYIGKTG